MNIIDTRSFDVDETERNLLLNKSSLYIPFPVIYHCFEPAVMYLPLVNLYLSQFPSTVCSPTETFSLWTEMLLESTKMEQNETVIIEYITKHLSQGNWSISSMDFED